MAKPPLRKIRIENIQSVEAGEIHPGEFTVIFGDSDVGKSTFPRALYALLTGRDLESIRSAGQTESHVRVELNGTHVQFNGSTYNVQKKDQKAWEEDGPSSSLSARKALGMPEVVVDKDLSFFPNLRRPLEPPFLITAYPPSVARILSSLTGTHEILAAYREANRRLGNAHKARASAQRALTDAQHALSQASEAPERHRKALELQRDLQDLRTRERSLEELRDSVDGFQGVFEELSRVQKYLDQTEDQEIPDIDALMERWTQLEALKEGVMNWTRLEMATGATATALETAQKQEVAARNALEAAIQHKSPCPYTGHPLPKECAESLVEVS